MSPRSISLSVCLVSALTLLCACGESKDPPPPDQGAPLPDSTQVDISGGADLTPDTSPDMGPDTSPDAGVDLVEVPLDVGPDIAPDLGPDVGPDIGPDMDNVPPAVKSTVPTSNATAVALDLPLSVTFTEDMDPTTATPTSFLLETQTVAVPGAVAGSGDTYTFTPTYPLCPLRSYSATVTTAFTDLAQNALVADHSWTFTTADGSWGSTTAMATNLDIARAAIAQTGDIFVAYASSGHIMVQRFDSATGTWGAATQVDNATAGVNWNGPSIAADASGNAVVVWRQDQPAATGDDAYAARYDATTKTWSTPQALETSANDVTQTPSVAMGLNGSAMVVYVQNKSVYYNTYSSAGAWGASTLVPGSAGDPRAIRVVSDSLNSFFAAWHDRVTTPTSYPLKVNRYDGTTNAWATASTALSTSASQNSHIGIAATPLGAVAVWRQQPTTGGGRHIFYSRYTAGTWSAGASVLGTTTTSVYAYEPDVAMDLKGNIIVAWTQGSAGVQTRRYDGTAGTWGAITNLGGAGYGDQPRVAFDAAGNALAVFDVNDSVYGARYLATGTTFGTPKLLRSGVQGWVDGITLAVNACGQGIAVASYADEGPSDPPDRILFR